MSARIDRDGVTARISGFPRRAVDRPDLKHAAVAVCVVEDGRVPALLITRRAARMRNHAGQWALPGGRIDDEEQPVDAALRELREELGLELVEADLLGALDDYATRSGYVITPFVFWGGADPHLRPDPAEVLSVHRIAFRELCRPDSPRFVSIPESDRPVVQLPIGGDLLHAPTAAVLLQFRRVGLEGVTERVADYEQPVFAWR